MGSSHMAMAPLSRSWAPLPVREPRRRGGWRQRLAAEDVGVGVGVAPRISRLFGQHLLDYCDGFISAKKLQALASMGIADGFQHPMLSRLAELQGGQHAQASLMRLLASCDIPQHISEFPDEFVTHALLPSTWIGLIHGYRHEFVHRLGADRQRLVSFWESFLSRPANEGLAANHPVVGGKRPEELATTVPLTVHADAGPFTKTTTCDCVSSSPLLGAGEAHFTKYLVASYVQKKSSPETDYPFWTRLLDNLLQLGSGVVDGQEVALDADGTLWTPALLFVKADEYVRANDFGLVQFGEGGGAKYAPSVWRIVTLDFYRYECGSRLAP